MRFYAESLNGSLANVIRARDNVISAALVIGALALYAMTLLPGVGSSDTAEFQRVVPQLGVAHPTGYPLYTLLGWLWSQILLLGTPAWRMNMFSALAAALTVGALYVLARRCGESWSTALLSAFVLAVSFTFWSQATIAEVYALAALLQVLLLLALLNWRAGRWPLWSVGILFGMGLAHHRTIVLFAPGMLLFVFFSTGQRSWRVMLGELLAALASTFACCLLYLYLPLRAPEWINSWSAFWQYVTGSAALSVWLATDAPLQVAWEHLRELMQRFIWTQFLPFGMLLCVLGVWQLWRRDRDLAALLVVSYAFIVGFCTLFFVQDVEVFLISAHVIAALMLGEGVLFLFSLVRRGTSARPRIAWLAYALLAGCFVVPVLLFVRNLTPIRAANTTASEQVARAILAQPLPEHALLIIDWDAVEGLRYLQAVEGQRRDIEILPLNTSVLRHDVDTALAAGRATYLWRPQPNLGLSQTPEGRLWRVSEQPAELPIVTTVQQRWQDGISLQGFTLPSGPYQPGDIVPVTLDWRAQDAPARRYALFVHIVGADGQVWAQQDREPSLVPTDQWQGGERIVDVYGPTLSQDTPPGRYQVLIGWYEYPSMQRLPLVVAATAAAADTYTLGEIDVLAGP